MDASHEQQFLECSNRIKIDLNDRFEKIEKIAEKESAERRILSTQFVNHIDWIKSKVESLRSANNVFLGLSEKAREREEKMLTLTKESQMCAESAKKDAEESRSSIRALVFSLIGGFALFIATNFWVKISDANAQREMIKALNEKIVQDDKNQKQTVEMLERLYQKLK
jgi:hypothetical protein